VHHGCRLAENPPIEGSPVFHLAGYHILLTALGVSIIIAFWLPRFVSGREPATSALLIMMGLGTFALLPGMPPALDPVNNAGIWETFPSYA
jgi:hypothetical protein